MQNPGGEPDQYVVAIRGDAAAWALVEPWTLSLPAGGTGVAEATFRPPPGTAAGTATFEVAVASTRLPDAPVVIRGIVRVTGPAAADAPAPDEGSGVPAERPPPGRVRMFVGDVAVEAVGGAVTSLVVGRLGAIPALLGLVAGAVVSVNVERLLVPVFRPSARTRRPDAPSSGGAAGAERGARRVGLGWPLLATVVVAVLAVVAVFTTIDLVRGESLVGDRKTTFFPKPAPSDETDTTTSPTTDGSPAVTGFSPESGPPGTLVTITGTSFTTPAEVEFNGDSVEALLASDTAMTAVVPQGATSGRLVVHLPGVDVTSEGSFTVTPPAPPTIEAFEPASGLAGTTVVAVTGTGFRPDAQVDVNGAPAPATVESDTRLTATVPEGATSGPIHVRVGDSTATSPADFLVLGP